MLKVKDPCKALLRGGGVSLDKVSLPNTGCTPKVSAATVSALAVMTKSWGQNNNQNDL